MKILILSALTRPDTFDYLLKESNKNIEWVFLFHYKPDKNDNTSEFQTRYPNNNISHVYWKDFLTPFMLLKKTKPDKIIFFEINDTWQIPLVIAAKKTKTTTFFIEHGVGNSVQMVFDRFKKNTPFVNKLINYFYKICTSLIRILHNRVFYFSVINQITSNKNKAKYLKLLYYFKIYSPIHSLTKCLFPERTPDYALLFNNNNVAPFLIYNILSKNRIINTGVPFFDNYYLAEAKADNYLVFIEHPYLEEKILGWNNEFHQKIAETLNDFASRNSIKIYVKLHPRSNLKNWTRYNFDQKYIEIIQDGNYTVLFLNAKLILSYSSTLICAFICAKKNVVLLGWHPSPHISGDNYAATGLCHKSLDLNELFIQYNFWIDNNLCLRNENGYNNFLKEYNYPFDGKAAKRVIETITNV